MNLYRHGFNNTLLDLGYSDAALIESITSSHLIADRRYAETEEENLLKISSSMLKNIRRNESPPKRRHDGTSPLPLGMDWSPPPRSWDGPNTIWPHDFHTGWSYCVTVPSWNFYAESRGFEPVVFYRVQIGLQSPEGVTTIHEVLKRFSDFQKLYSDLKRSFRSKTLPPGPPKGVLRLKSRALLEEQDQSQRRCCLEAWMEKVLSDIDISRSAPVACFLELEAAARSSFRESSHHLPNVNQLSENDSSTLSKEISEGKEEKFLSKSSDERISLDQFQKGPSYTHSHHQDSVEYSTDVKNSMKGTSSDTQSEILNSCEVEDLETEPESKKQNGKENLEQAISVERGRFTQMQWDMEELRAKYVEMEFRFKSEQDEKAHAIEENEALQQELESAREQLKNLQKSHDLKSKSDVKLLVKEVKSVRRSQSKLQQELDRVLKERMDFETRLEKERMKRGSVDAANRKLLRKCEILRGQLEECSGNFVDEQENKLTMELPADALDMLATSENRIGLLLAEAQLLAQENAAADTSASHESDDLMTTDNELRKMVADVLIDNAILRKRENYVLRCALNTYGSSSISQQQL